MKTLVALYDRAIEGYGPIMTVHTRGEAIRSFKKEAETQGSNINAHPTDYELWQVGTYDDETGHITAQPERIARAEDYVQTKG